MSNLQKRILTSIIALPASLFFIFTGGYTLLFFLLTIFFIGNYELFSVFKNKTIILFLDLVLILSLFSIFLLRDESTTSLILLIWFILLAICSDIGGYAFGKTFKWKKITKISPKKTLSGVIGSFILSLGSLFIMDFIYSTFETTLSSSTIRFIEPKFFFLAIIFSLTAQAGDLTISYFKRLEKIKDTGKILPGHGGIFDRIDSLMFVIILGFILYNFNIIL